MNIIEKMLSMTNQGDMGAIIRTYTDESYHDIDMTEHLQAWADNKQHIFELFGNSFKIEQEVETQLPYTMIKDKLNSFLSEEFIEAKYNLIKVFLLNLSTEEVGSNVLEQDFAMFDTTFKKGIKVSKCFKQLIKKQFLDEATTKYSMFLQSLKAKGTAVLSIDPIDFLTMSANNSGWRSCHAPDGEYRVGQIAYMMDEVSVISYVKSSEDCMLSNGTTIHTNKIWRQICLINPNNTYAMQARQYPANNDANAFTVGKMLSDVISKWTGSKYATHKANVDDRYFYELQDNHGYDTLYYNDIVNDAFDKGYMIIPADEKDTEFFNKVGSEDFPKIIVGSDVKCLCGCGSYLDNAEYYFEENSNYDYDYDDYDNDYDEYED